jgi:penicillin-binding protein 1C
VGAALLAVAAYVATPLPASLQQPGPGTLTLLDRHGQTLAQLASATARAQMPLPLGELGPWLPKVTVALEDHRFFEHGGIDWRGTLGSAWRDLRAGRIVGGGSTITQQLIKMASSRRGRSWGAKLYEAVAAWKLERSWSKERILTEYLSRSDYGNRLLGPEAAARWYFHKPARDLTLAEAVFLAGLPQAPSRFNPWLHRPQAEARYHRALATLAVRGTLSPEQAGRMAAEVIQVGHFVPGRKAPHFVETIRRAHPDLTGPVRTTLDLDLQERAEELVRSHLRTLNRHDVTCAAVVVLENATGAVRAMVGSPDFVRSEVNEAVAAHSAGSTLKPFLYLRAIATGTLTAASILPDTQEAIREAYADYDPQDYTRHYLGPVRVREALACSLNVPAVVALRRTGAREVFVDLARWGFSLPRGLETYGAGFILGNAEVRPLDLAAAYAGLARGGIAVAPTMLAGAHHPAERIVPAEAAAIVTDILCDNEARRRAFGTHSPLALARRVAAKTGTSSGFRDAWTVGFTHDHTVAVWVGNADGRPMKEALSIRAAAPLWAAIVDGLLPGDAPVDPPAESRQLVRVDNEWFLAGTEASRQTLAEKDGHPVLPAEYAAWCAGPYNTIGAICPAAGKLAISRPWNGAHFELDPALPRSQQKLELACTGGAERAVRWFVNEQEQPAQANGKVFWTLERGAWRIRAEAEGQSREVQVTVE